MASESERFAQQARALRGDFFDRERPITVAHAPGWVDLIGGAAPGGPLALGWPLGQSAFVALQPDPEPAIRLRVGDGPAVELPAAALWGEDGWPHEYAAVAARLAAAPPTLRLAAAAYAALLREEFARFPGGARLLVRPAAGPGWQVAAAAALAQALVSAYGVRLAPRELALSVREGLRRVTGHDPGELGALVGVCAPSGALLLVHRQPAWVWGSLHLPHGAAIWALRAGDGFPPPAPDAEAAAAIAYRLAADAAGLSPAAADARWRGYLANLGGAGLARVRDALPETLRGEAYLREHGPHPDGAVRPRGRYSVRAAAALAVEEHVRARTAAALLRAAGGRGDHGEELALVGELMLQSHGAQRAAGLDDPHALALARRVYAAGPTAGLYGARAPAAASGATLVVLGSPEAGPALRSIAESYAAEAGAPVTIFDGTAAGCSPAGTREI
jgi:hypothetical protein